jgi:phosphohistidine swiveling domain-containing protein
MKLPLNPKKEIFLWGPIPGRFFYTSAFTEINYKYFCQKFLGANWSRTLFLFRAGRMVWINEFTALRAAGLRVFKKFMLPAVRRAASYREWRREVKRLSSLEEQLARVNLARLSNDELLKWWQNFHRVYLDFWVIGTLPELGNYSADNFLESELGRKIKDKTKILEAMEILTAPTQPSFYQEEEIDLTRCRDLKKHQQKYFWLKNSYAGTQVLPLSFFAKRKKELPSSFARTIENKIKQVKLAKRKLARQYHLSGKIMAIANAVSVGIAWQDQRKKNIFIALHYQNILLKEVVRRFGYRHSDLLNCWFWEIAKIIQGGKINDLSGRRQGVGVNFYKDCKMLSSAQVKKFWDIYTRPSQVDGNNEIKGVVASRGQGKVTGRVRIVLDPLKEKNFKKGEILVAPMTSPEYVFLMKKAAAIVTDAGGLTSHAAIVSRELGVPCIVGTKIATQVLKDNDTVEVDAGSGIIKKI